MDIMPQPENVSEYQVGDERLVHRSKLILPDYNPRHMPEENRRRLAASIKTFGLVGNPIWNERTGRVIAGVQRVLRLDKLQGNHDYTLKVTAVDWDEAKEVEFCVAHNNQHLMGVYNPSKLAECLKRTGVNYEHTGYHAGDLVRMYGKNILQEDPKVLVDLAEAVRATQEAMDRETQRVETRDDPDFFTVLVFHDHAHRKLASDLLGWKDNKFQNGQSLIEAIRAGGERVAHSPTALVFVCESELQRERLCKLLGIENTSLHKASELFEMIETPAEE